MVDYNQLPDNSRVWVYQSNKAFSDADVVALRQKIQEFVDQWLSHNVQVQGWGDVKYNRFVVLAVDESHEAPSGCSIDSSMALIKAIESEWGVNMLDRFNFAYKVDADTVDSADKADFAKLYSSNKINLDTIVFNNLVATKADLESKWEVALGNSWHANMV
jgi:hypothetical protein